MTLNKRMERQLRCDIDLAEFHLLDVIPQRHQPAVVLLVPRQITNSNSFFCVKRGYSNQWHCDLDHALKAAVVAGYMSRLRAWIISRRYLRIKERIRT